MSWMIKVEKKVDSIPHIATNFLCVLIQVSSCKLLSTCLLDDPSHFNESTLMHTSIIYSIHASVFRKTEGLQFCMPHFPYP